MNIKTRPTTGTATRTASRPAFAVGMIKGLGERLVSEDRPPYEMTEHDEAVDFNEPTDEIKIGKATLGKNP